MIDHQQYKNCGGTLDEIEFNQLEPSVCRLIDSYIKSKVPYWRVRPIEEYGIDFTEIITLEIDFISKNGGLLAFNGKSDFHFKSASTSGFNFEIDDANIQFVQGVPFSTIAKQFLDYELLNAGLTVACL